MILTLHYTVPVGRGLQCEHCDEFIVGEKFVRFSLGLIKLSFHKECFGAVLYAVNKFDTEILKHDAKMVYN